MNTPEQLPEDFIMQLSTLPVLIIVIFGFLWFLVRRARRIGEIDLPQRKWLTGLLFILVLWGGFIGYQSSIGVFATERFMAMLPGYWLPYIPVIVVNVLLLLVTPLRSGIANLINATPRYWLSGIHIVRVLAIGSLVKASMGLFPEKFAWFVGVPDLLFGLSAIPVTLMLRSGRLSDRILMYWHFTGALTIILPIAGLMHLFMGEALFIELFVFPMVLAPALVVPTLIMLNLMVALRLLGNRVVLTSPAGSCG
jgi:hypothetical protein